MYNDTWPEVTMEAQNLVSSGAGKIAANFAAKDEKVDKSIAQNQLQQLKLEAEELFSFCRYQETEDVLQKILQLEIELYAENSKQVQDTEFELEGLTKSISEASATKSKKKKGVVNLNFSDSKGYEPGLECAKMLMANSISKTGNGCLFSNEKTALRLYRQAYEHRLEEFGPESLLMLLAQRLYYIEAAEILGVRDCICPKAKEELTRKLKNILGSSHPLCKDLESALQMQDNTCSVQLENAISKALLHEPKLQHDVFKLDQRRIEIARSLVADAVSRGPAAVTNAKFQLAQTLMDAFESEEALRFLMDVFKARVELLGYQHVDTVTALDALCNFNVSRDFVSVSLLKELNLFLISIANGMVGNLFIHPTTIKASFFGAFIAGKVLEIGDGKFNILFMRNARQLYARMYGLSDRVLFCVPSIKGKVVMHPSTPIVFCNQLDETSDRQDFLAVSRKVYFDPHHTVHIVRQNMEVLIQMYSKASKYLKPHDPIKVHILQTYGDCIDKLHKVKAEIRVNDIKFLKTETKKLSKRLGDNHPLVIKATVACGHAESKCGGMLSAKVISEYESCLKICQDVFGPQHEITALAQEALGHILAKFRKYHPKAKKLLQESTENMKQAFKPYEDHTIIIEHHSRVLITYQDIGDSAAATEKARILFQAYDKKRSRAIIPEDMFAISH